MKNLLSILAILIFSLGFSQVKKPVKKKYTPKKRYVQKKKVSENTILEKETTIGFDPEISKKEKEDLQKQIDNEKAQREAENAKKIEELKTDERISQKILKTNGYIHTWNWDAKGKVQANFKGVYVYQKNNKIYFLLELENRSLIDYSVDMISFSKKTGGNQEGEKRVDEPDNSDNNLYPIASFPNQSIFKGKTKTKLVLVFKKFSISENTNLDLNISEKNGDRDLQINVRGTWFVGAKSIR